MSTNYVDISGSWSCPRRSGKIITITQTGAAGRAQLNSESWTFQVRERVPTIDNGITGDVSQDGKVIVWSNGHTYTRATNIIESCVTGRYLFEAGPDGDVSSKREAEGGWIHENNKPALTADDNYDNRAHWTIVPVEGQPGKVFIESNHTGRYLFEAGPEGDVSSKREAEGGWIHENNKPALTADANYYNRATWKIVPVEGQPGKVFIESCVTGRYLFEAAPEGDVSSKRGAEGGWIHENNKPALTADANYYNRATWKINAVPHVPKVIKQRLPNVKNENGVDDVPRLWCAVDTAGAAGVPIGFLELTWVDQGNGHRKGHLYARKDGGAWVGISTDAAEHELTRESFEIPAAVLGGKLELGYSVGHGGGHKLYITNAEVEITDDVRKDLIEVGNHSGRCPKVVTLPSAGLQVSSTPVNPQHPNWNDKFRVEVEGDQLKVFRQDNPNIGWAQPLVLGLM